MVKLVFDSGLSLGGISRRTQVELVTGQVSGKSKSGSIILKSKKEIIEVQKGATQVVLKAPEVRPLSAPIMKSEVDAKPLPAKRVAPPSVAVAPAVTEAVPVSGPQSHTPQSQTQVPVPVPVQKPAVTVSLPVILKKSISLQWIGPKPQSVFRLPEMPSELKVPVRFEWSGSPLNQALLLRVFSANKPTHPVFEKWVTPNEKGYAMIQLSLDKPGSYLWKLTLPESLEWNMKPSTGAIQVLADFVGIELMTELVGDSDRATNEFSGELKQQFEGITLRWKKPPFELTKGYDVSIYRNSTESKAVLQKNVRDEKYSFNKGKLLTAQLNYEIQAQVADTRH
jgi:hypothetical protein